MHKYPREMSGGMQQRVGIARAIALRPKLLLLDEPFGRLDSLTRMDLQDTILGILDKERITTMLITHDVDEAVYMADRVCMMTNGPRAKRRPDPRRAVRAPPQAQGHPRVDLFYDLRGSLVDFLAKNEKEKPGEKPKVAPRGKTCSKPPGMPHEVFGARRTRPPQLATAGVDPRRLGLDFGPQMNRPFRWIPT